jgi:hypothetical protein
LRVYSFILVGTKLGKENYCEKRAEVQDHNLRPRAVSEKYKSQAHNEFSQVVHVASYDGYRFAQFVVVVEGMHYH